jgi:hypothetical protein
MAIGIDIGGTWVRIAWVRGTRLVQTKKFRTPRNKDGLTRLLVREVPSSNREPVGVSVAGTIKGTRVLSMANAHALDAFDFAWLPGLMRVDNDARCWLRGALSRGRTRSPRVLGLTLGTGVGRAIAERGVMRRVALFEQAESWESEYQIIRRRPDLAIFVAWHLRSLLEKYQPTLVLLGGGVIEHRPQLAAQLRYEFGFVRRNMNVRVPRQSEWLGCLGATID